MTFDDSYVQILKEIRASGDVKNNRTGVKTQSLFTRIIEADDAEGWNGYPISNLRKIYFKGALFETYWFMGLHANHLDYKNLSLTNTKYLTDHNVHYWDPWASEGGNLGPVYGEQLCRWKKYTQKSAIIMDQEDAKLTVKPINQLQYIIDTLNSNPDDRRLVTNLWNPAEIDKMALPPCHYGMEFYSRPLANGKRALDLTWHQRSCDMPIGIPYNVQQYTIIDKIIAMCTEHVPGKIKGVLGNCHIYENQIPMVDEMIRRYDAGEHLQCSKPFIQISDDLIAKIVEKKRIQLSDIDINGTDIELFCYNPLKSITIPVAV